MKDIWFKATLLLVSISFLFWVQYQVHSFTNQRYTIETNLTVISMQNLTTPVAKLPALQFIVFATHVAPDQWITVPLWLLFPSPLTLLLEESFVMALTGVLIFIIARDMVKNDLFSFLLVVCYLLNWATINVQRYDYHNEIFLVPAYLLVFYSIMKVKPRLFYVSLVFLLGVFESVFSVAFMLGIGILAYEMIYDKDTELKPKRMSLVYDLLVGSILALVLYNLIWMSLNASYSSLNVPTNLQVPPYPFVPASFNLEQGTSVTYTTLSPTVLLTVLLIICTTVLIGYGMVDIFALPVQALLIAPWLFAIFILHNTYFLYSWRYNYVIGGCVVGAILGYGLLAKDNKSVLLRYVPVAMVLGALISFVFTYATVTAPP